MPTKLFRQLLKIVLRVYKLESLKLFLVFTMAEQTEVTITDDLTN